MAHRRASAARAGDLLPLRVLFVSREYPPETGGGGIGSYLAEIAPALAALGHEVHVLSCDAGQAERDTIDRGVQIHRRPYGDVRGLHRVQAALRAPEIYQPVASGLAAYREYRRLGVSFDVVEYPDWGAEGWSFACHHDLPLVAHLHAPLAIVRRHQALPLSPQGSWCISALERFAVHGADVVTAPSQRLVDALTGIGWLRGRNVEIVPPPLDARLWSEAAPVSQTGPVVLFLGKLAELKAPETLVEALTILRREVPTARGLFVAPIWRERDGLPTFEWVGRTLDLTACEFTGFVPRSELLQHVGRARVLALTSRFEAFGMVVAEAMAAGRAAVVTEAAGVAELLRSAGVGSIVPTGDSVALATALRPYLFDAGYAADAGGRARAAVREYLDPSTIAGRRVELYRRAMKRFAGRRPARALTAAVPTVLRRVLGS